MSLEKRALQIPLVSLREDVLEIQDERPHRNQDGCEAKSGQNGIEDRDDEKKDGIKAGFEINEDI